MVRKTKKQKACLLNLAKCRASLLRARLARANLAASSASLVNQNAIPATALLSEHLNCARASSQSTATFIVNPIIAAGSSHTFFTPILPKVSSNNENNAGGYNENPSFVFLAVPNLPLIISPITGVQQSNLSQTTSKALHCLLCSKETTQNLTSRNNCTDQEADFLVMFLLKKMLGVPSENLVEYLSTLGHPRGWVSICHACSPVVTGAFAVQKQISKLEEKLRTFQDKMKEAIVSSYLENQKKFQSVGATPPAFIPKSNPVVVIKESSDHVVSDMERINKRARARQISLETSLTSHAKEVQSTTFAAPSETKKLSVDSDIMECDDHASFSDEPSNNLLTTTTSDLTEPSCDSSNGKARKNRKQTLPVSRYGLTEEDIIITDVQCSEFEDPAVENDEKDGKSNLLPTLMKFNQIDPKEEVLYCCAMCPNLKSMPIRSFVKHLVYHSDWPYKCSECSAYSTGDEMELAKRSSDNQSASHVCRRETLVKVNLETVNIWECGFCSEAFKLESERELHEASAHSKKDRIPLPHNCSRCSKKFRDYPEWQIHRALEHPDLAKVGCLYCDEIFKLKLKEAVDVVDGAARNRHMRKQHGQSYMEPFECRTCGANFKSQSDHKMHAQTEHGNNSNKLYWCPVCFKSAEKSTAIYFHLHNFHSQRVRERFICDLCAYGTVHHSLLVEHRFLAHDMEPENKETKIYSCTTEDCSFRCIQKRTFDLHMMKVHNAERRFKCRICGRGFLVSTQRNDHERTHGRAKPFQCEICGNSFAVKNYLYIHMRLSHQNRPFASTNRKRPSNSKSRKPVVQNLVEKSTSHSSVPDCTVEQSVHSAPHPVQNSIPSLQLLANSAAAQSTRNDE